MTLTFMNNQIDSIWIDVYLRVFEYGPEVLAEYYQDLSDELGISVEYCLEEFV